MICRACRVAADAPRLQLQLGNYEMVDWPASRHDMCRGATWCDCQHRTERVEAKR